MSSKTKKKVYFTYLYYKNTFYKNMQTYITSGQMNIWYIGWK